MLAIISTKNHSPLSWMIRKMSGSNSSHLAIVFDDKFIIQSNLLGFGMDYYPTFIKKQTVVKRVDISSELGGEDHIWSDLMDIYGTSDYDLKALFYDGWRFLLHKTLKIRLPSKNKYNSPNKYLCTEVIGVLDTYLKTHYGFSLGLGSINDLSAVTPMQVIDAIEASMKGVK